MSNNHMYTLSVLEEYSYAVLPETDWAWLAGAIDGEGNLRVYKIGRRYTAVLRVFNIDRSFIEKVAKIMQGNILYKAGDTPFRTRTCLYVQISKTCKLYYILQRVLPYLTVKRRLAELVLEYLEIRMSNIRYIGKEEDIVKLCEGVMSENRERGKVYNSKGGGVYPRLVY